MHLPCTGTVVLLAIQSHSHASGIMGATCRLHLYSQSLQPATQHRGKRQQIVVWLCLVISRKLSGVPERILIGFATRAYLDNLLGGERAMYRALPGDLEELRALLLAQRPVEFDCQLDRIDPPFLGFALGAIVCVDPRVSKPGRDAPERQTFPLGVHREGHRRARP